MKVEFEKEYLRSLYETGKTVDKKHRFQPQVINGYVKCVKTLLRISRMEDLITNKNIMAKMIANALESFRPYHPGELLKEELAYRHLSQKEVAKQLGLPYTAFNEILNGKRPVTTDFALYMEAGLGIPAYLLIGMQTDYNLQVAKKDKSILDRLAKIRKVAAAL
jgi:addiction module HigA family antidote